MSLKQSLVVKSEYTIKDKSTGKGSRGSSPGSFVYDYMARKGCSDTMFPLPNDPNKKIQELVDDLAIDDTLVDEYVEDIDADEVVPNLKHKSKKVDKNKPIDNYVNRYMARESAVEALRTENNVSKEQFFKVDDVSGVAFSHDNISLSDDELRSVADEIQQAFDNGKTVKKTVISFDEEYLKKHGIVDENLIISERGDYKGNYDQAKLRGAITRGMNRFVGKSKTTKWVAVIQNDTKHLHCHLCITDTGVGKLSSDGTQKGKLSQSEISLLRRGIDSYLDEKQTIASLTADIQADTMHLKTVVANALLRNNKDTLNNAKDEVFLRSLMCVLPKNKSKWSANSNSKEMKKANAMVGSAVDKELNMNPRYQELLGKIDRYCEIRRDLEDLDDKAVLKLKADGIDRVRKKCINTIYTECKTIKGDKEVTPTNFIKNLASENAALTEGNDVKLLNLRRKKAFKDKYNKDFDKYYKLKRANIENHVENTPFGKYIDFEYNFTRMLLGKYNRFLSPILDPNYHQMYTELLTTDDELYRDYLMAKLAMKFIGDTFSIGYNEPLSSVRFLDLYLLDVDINAIPMLDLKLFNDICLKRYDIYNRAYDYLKETDSDLSLMLNPDVISMYNFFRDLNSGRPTKPVIEKVEKVNVSSIVIPNLNLDKTTDDTLDRDLD